MAVLPTSGTFDFQSIEIELIIREAFEKIGISGEFVEPVKLDSAKRSIDLIFLEWMNKSVNLWTIENAYLNLGVQKTRYILDETVSNITQVNLRTSTRQVTSDGVAYSQAGGVPSGVAANAFDGNPFNACTQTAPNGYISYTYAVGEGQQINFIGITSHTTQEYTLTVRSSSNETEFGFAFDIPTQTYEAGITKWFDTPASINTREYRITETDGATLDIREIYFNNNVQDLPLSNVSRNDYYSYTNKYQTSRPSVYYLDRQIQPVLNLWPIPTTDYNCLQYSYKKMIQDTGSLYTNAVQIPSRFYPALIWRLSWELAIKFAPDRAQMLGAQADMAFESATVEDTESTPLTVYPDYSSYYE